MSEKTNKDWKKFKEENFSNEEEVQNESEALIDEDVADFEETIPSLEFPAIAELEEKLTLSEQKAHENWEKATRAVAELENVRRRSEREVTNAHKYGLEKIIDGLLPVIDSLEQALQLADKDENASMHEGLSLTMKLFLDVLTKYKVEQVDPIGEIFNPELHEAMSMQESPDAKANTILVVFQKGYKLNERVIRPARVIVAK
ncbi:MAG: nucleotide exchange factor GrpE [Legionellaceae bacterium]|nr:nucleotide exchange factor GrpE [Legionellaceae bacterium]